MIQARDSNSYLHKDVILSMISEYDIFRFYCNPFRDVNHRFCSELRKDTNPTCKIVFLRGKLIYKDFATGDALDCFDYICKKFNLTFIEALKVVDADFGLGLTTGQSLKPAVAMTYGNVEYRPPVETKLQKRQRPWIQADKDYWAQFGISIELLEAYNVEAIDHYWINDDRYKCKSLGYAYKFGPRMKIYQPLESREKKWISNTKKTDLQGYEQLPATGELVLLASSLKDVMTLRSLGYYAIAMQGESIVPDVELIHRLQQRFKLVAVLYDNDFTKTDNPGQTIANKVCATYHLLNIVLPSHYKSKDISDFVRDHGKQAALRIIRIQLPITIYENEELP